MPAIAVIIPVYNRSDRLGEAIASVLAQDFGDFELIVVDDGSDDGSAAVAAGNGDPRLRCLQLDRNLGGGAARNRGIRAASSPIICFLDSDDLFLPHKLRFIDTYFRDNPQIDVLLDSFEIVFPKAGGDRASPRTNPDLTSTDEVIRAIYAREAYKATPAISARRDALVRAGLFDETLQRRQDMDLILRLGRSASLASTSEVLWTKRWSADSISARHETFAAAMGEICARHPEYLARPEYRVGLARDAARHFLRLVRHGRLATAVKDFRECGAHFGLATTARLLSRGAVEMLRRASAGRKA